MYVCMYVILKLVSPKQYLLHTYKIILLNSVLKHIHVYGSHTFMPDTIKICSFEASLNVITPCVISLCFTVDQQLFPVVAMPSCHFSFVCFAKCHSKVPTVSYSDLDM